MPIGWLIGASIALIIVGIVTILSNGDDPKAGNPARLTISAFRVFGYWGAFIGFFSLIGTLSELYVR